MPDVMVFHTDPIESEFIERIAADAGFRCKSTASSTVAREWIRMGEFSAIFVHREMSLRTQHEIAEALWAGNPESTFVVFDFDHDDKYDAGEARLLGAEVAAGKTAMQRIKDIFAALKQRRSVSADAFRVMVVEDLDSPRYVISLYVEEMGYPHVDGFGSALEALEALEGSPDKYHCVVTDIRMPVMDGRQLITRIRSHPKLLHLPVIVLTAYGTSDALIDCLNAGASGFLVKPPKKADFVRELARARRISAGQASPRLASPDEVETIRRILESKGLV